MSKYESKLAILLEIEGCETEDEFCREFFNDSMCPGICMNPGCEYTTFYEHDQRAGFCEICRTNTVESGFSLMGII